MMIPLPSTAPANVPYGWVRVDLPAGSGPVSHAGPLAAGVVGPTPGVGATGTGTPRPAGPGSPTSTAAPLDPFGVKSAYHAHPGEFVAGGALLVLALLGAGAVALFYAAGADRRRLRQEDRVRRASAAWGTRKSCKELFVKDTVAGRVDLGQLNGRRVAQLPRQSVLILAPTGSQKTAAYAVQVTARWDGPAVVTGVKRDLPDLTAAARLARGPVYRLSPGQEGQTVPGVLPIRFDVLAGCTDFAGADTVAARLGSSARPPRGRSGSGEYDHWEKLAVQYVTPLLLLAARSGKSIQDVYRWTTQSDEVELTERVYALQDENAKDGWDATVGSEARAKGAIKNTAQAMLSVYAKKAVQDATRVDVAPADPAAGGSAAGGSAAGESLAYGTAVEDPATGDQAQDQAGQAAADVGSVLLSPQQLLEQKATLYIYCTMEQTKLFAPFFQFVINSVVAAQYDRVSRDGACAAPGNAVLLMLEEAGNVAPLSDLPGIASAGTAQGVVLVSVWQDLSQIDYVYGQEARDSIVNNHTARIWLARQNDLKTMEHLRDLLGKHPVDHWTESWGKDGKKTRTRSKVMEDLAPVSWISTLPLGDAICKVTGYPPLLLKAVPYWRDPSVLKLLDPDVVARYNTADSVLQGNQPKAGRRRGRDEGRPGGAVAPAA